MQNPKTPRAELFEGSPAAAEFIERVQRFIADELAPLAAEHGISHEKGADKALLGETAAKLRGLRKPDPYKGKGIKYAGEAIRRKVGKKAGAK